MLTIDVTKIPPEGLELQESFTAADVHLEGNEEFQLGDKGRLEGRADLGDEGSVHVSGRLQADLRLACGRCLEDFDLRLDQRYELFCLPHRPDQEQEDEVELTERDMVVAYYRDHTIDLGEMVREQFFLSLPMKRLCREDCKGLCPKCGVNRNRETCDCRVDEADPRLAQLGKLLGR
jgi:uncharacterized protein